MKKLIAVGLIALVAGAGVAGELSSRDSKLVTNAVFEVTKLFNRGGYPSLVNWQFTNQVTSTVSVAVASGAYTTELYSVTFTGTTHQVEFSDTRWHFIANEKVRVDPAHATPCNITVWFEKN